MSMAIDSARMATRARNLALVTTRCQDQYSGLAKPSNTTHRVLLPGFGPIIDEAT